MENRLKLAVILSATILVAEVVGALLSNSLALLSDAGHVFTDVLALSLSWFGVRQAARPATSRMTFGYHRVGILIALINAVSVVAIAGYIFHEALARLREPPQVNSLLMFGVALVGLVANLIVVFWLVQAQRQSLNVRSAFLHAWGDALASVGVLVSGIVIFFTGWFWVDPVASIFIGLVIAVSAWGIIREAVSIFLEAAPGHLNVQEMVKAVQGVPGVKDVHDLHVWTVAPRLHALSCHVLIEDQSLSEGANILEKVKGVLEERFHIGHATVQLECDDCGGSLYCSLTAHGEDQPEESHHHH